MSQIPVPFNADDDGRADRALIDALVEGIEVDVVESLREKRLFVGVVALLKSTHEHGGEKESEMALALLEHEGSQVLPVFTSVDSLTRWREDARPVAVLAEAAGLQVIADEMAGLLIDPLDVHVSFLGVHAVRALVLGYPLVPFSDDAHVLAVLDEAVSREPAAVTAWIEPSDEVDAVVTVLIPDLPTDQARPIAERIVNAVAGDAQVRLRIERGIDVQVVTAR